MKNLILNLKNTIKELGQDASFIHYKWFVKYHLEIVESISIELCEIYKDADRDLVEVLVWMHDYGKIININNEHSETQTSGKSFLLHLGFSSSFSEKVIDFIGIIDSKNHEELSASPIEIQIVSSADGASHLISPFYHAWFYENPETTFEDLLQESSRKIKTDWEIKITLPEVKASFVSHYEVLRLANGECSFRPTIKKL